MTKQTGTTTRRRNAEVKNDQKWPQWASSDLKQMNLQHQSKGKALATDDARLCSHRSRVTQKACPASCSIMHGCKGRIQARAVVPSVCHQCSIQYESSRLAHGAEQAEIDTCRRLVTLTDKSRICKLPVGKFQSLRSILFRSNRNVNERICGMSCCNTFCSKRISLASSDAHLRFQSELRQMTKVIITERIQGRKQKSYIARNKEAEKITIDNTSQCTSVLVTVSCLIQ